MKILISFILLFTSFSATYAQNTAIDSSKSITPTIKDSRINKLDAAYKSTYRLEGYRIQIFSGNKRQPAKEARLRFSRIYRKTKAHEIYEQPYFKVRVGDFKTKLEALKFKNELNKHFPNCFIVKDEIEFKD
ncbi:MAG: SPOR domain-containing protein [Vicingaceae bacterium]|nr:SPOR domain-containing protein [Vicingaceae bacterium]